MKDRTKTLHDKLGVLVADALSDIEMGREVNLAIDIANSGVTIENHLDTPTAAAVQPRAYAFGDAEPAQSSLDDDQASESSAFALGSMVRIRHADGFLPNPGKIVSLTTSLIAEADYLVEYWLYGEAKTVWMRAAAMEHYAADADAAAKKAKEEDEAAALRVKARATLATQPEDGQDGSFLVTGECQPFNTLFYDIANAAAANGQVGSFTAYFRPNDDVAQADEPA